MGNISWAEITFLGARIAGAGTDDDAFPNELFVMRAVDADGSFRSELGEAEQWAGKVKAYQHSYYPQQLMTT